MKVSTALLALLIALVAAGQLRAQQQPSAILEDRPDADADLHDPQLGPLFESLAAGIAFRPPADGQQIRRPGSGEEIVQYVNEKQKWTLRVSRMLLSEPVPLIIDLDASGKPRGGVLESMIAQLQLDAPGAQILRQDVINIGDVPVAMIAARTQLGLETRLRQQAILKDTEQSYYLFDMSSTAPAPKDGELDEDPKVKAAVELFNRVIDTARLLDQTAIRRDQDERLYRTRALLVNLTPARLTNALVAEQWIRIVRDGKDIGYSYIVEEVATDLPKRRGRDSAGGPQGVRIGMRTRTLPEQGIQLDAETWMFCTLDKQNEIWRTIGVLDDGKGDKEQYGEIGISEQKTVAVRDDRLAVGEEIRPGVVDRHQPPVRQSGIHRLDVTHFTLKQKSPPVARDLPPFYLPQALGHLLPRLVYLHEGKTYMFASYVSDQREVMKRFVDVGHEREVTLGGQKVRAIPVDERIGLEGAITTHYISPQGKYLGSVNRQAKLELLPTDADTLTQLWKDADLTRPADVEDAERGAGQ